MGKQEEKEKKDKKDKKIKKIKSVAGKHNSRTGNVLPETSYGNINTVKIKQKINK